MQLIWHRPPNCEAHAQSTHTKHTHTLHKLAHTHHTPQTLTEPQCTQHTNPRRHVTNVTAPGKTDCHMTTCAMSFTVSRCSAVPLVKPSGNDIAAAPLMAPHSETCTSGCWTKLRWTHMTTGQRLQEQLQGTENTPTQTKKETRQQRQVTRHHRVYATYQREITDKRMAFVPHGVLTTVKLSQWWL